MRIPTPLLGTFAVLAFSASAQENQLAPLTRALFQHWVGSETGGVMVFETSDKVSHQCAYSSKTYFERDHRKTEISGIQAGQPLEVLLERNLEPPRCRALIVRVLTPAAYAAQRRMRNIPSPTESFAPRGTLVYSGVVVDANNYWLVLRLRSGERQRILLRDDTKFFGAGSPAARNGLPRNRPIQIRAGKTFDNEIEAFSIVWGEILQPKM
ncbi:MAG: hypothetical protein HY820_16940 [Acidobacteria bacterium]|nr:hypothetical protein [Acidobacteriota bacterium]